MHSVVVSKLKLTFYFLMVALHIRGIEITCDEIRFSDLC